MRRTETYGTRSLTQADSMMQGRPTALVRDNTERCEKTTWRCSWQEGLMAEYLCLNSV